MTAQMNWYKKSSKEVLGKFKVNLEKGLSSRDVSDRLKQYGPNILAREKKETILGLFIRQFKSPLIYILLVAAILVLLLGDFVDALVIMAVITINSIVGTVQEGRARNSLNRLRSLTRHKALVRRDGDELLISAEDIVPGDILILKEGDRVGADGRIVRSETLKIDESVMTGEAYVSLKSEKVIKKEGLIVGDQVNMVFSGTSVVAGYGEVVVVATGFESKLGEISKEIKETSSVPLPLQQKVMELTHFIALAVFAIAIFIFVVGILRGIEPLEMLSAAIATVVSLIPEGLPIAVTIVLARGVWRMARARAIVRQMAAVEAMGNADTLLVDKTGTLTTGKMVIRRVLFCGERFEVTGEGYEPVGSIESKMKVGIGDLIGNLKEIMAPVYLSLKADVVKDEHHGWRPSGDPTEVAIAVLCRKLGLSREKLEEEFKTVFTKPFDSERRFIEASFAEGKKDWHVFVGAPDFLGKHLGVGHDLLQNSHELAKEGLRVIGVAVFSGDRKLAGSCLLAIDEEIREEVSGSILEAKNAGFNVVMLTGDYGETAKEIARNVGIYKDGDGILAGVEVERLGVRQIAEKLKTVSVFARISPEHKLKIVKAYQLLGKVCVMTGDGVNDAPALQAANLGIALGSGTQVAKDSADIVLVDDNFKTIVEAISEGRAIYLTLKKVILYLFSTSFAEVIVLAVAIAVGLPLPLVAVQIIWLNFVTDGFFVVALAQQKTKQGLISKEEVQSDKLVDNFMVLRIISMGVSMTVALPVFYYYLGNHSLEYARTMALLVLAVTQWFNSLNVRSRYLSIFRKGIDNPYMIFSFVAVSILQYLIIGTAWGNRVMHTTGISFNDWVLGIVLATSVIWVEEARKILFKVKVQRILS